MGPPHMGLLCKIWKHKSLFHFFFFKVQWNFQAVMSSDRMGGASAAISGGTRLWVTGGVPSAHGRPPIV